MKEYTITLTMGDWSHDGHNMTDVVAISCNLTVRQLENAYDKGVKITGVDLTNGIAEDYEDSSFPDEDIAKLEKHGFKKDDMLEQSYRDKGKYCVDSAGFWMVWLWIASIGNPKLQYKELDDSKSNINIGGYGMFCS